VRASSTAAGFWASLCVPPGPPSPRPSRGSR
jgi:hypothetical protein